MSSDEKDFDYLEEQTSNTVEDVINCENVTECSENNSLVDSASDLGVEKINEELRIKPEHWTDEYWHTITSTYKWFLHKDGYAGCGICYVNKSFMGKKSLIATMKMRLMELSYVEFEKKLLDHKASTQHGKSVLMYRMSFRKNNVHGKITMNESIIRTSLPKKEPTIDYKCQFCDKGYKLKKALVKHIYCCTKASNNINFLFPCGCEGLTFGTISNIDTHNSKGHSDKFIIQCIKCPTQYRSAVSLFEHLLMVHNHQWNPLLEIPTVTESVSSNNVINSSSRPGRNKSYLHDDDIYLRYDTFEDERVEPKRRKLQLEEPLPDNKIERIVNREKKEVSHLKLSLDQIHTCQHCGGRYLSLNILNEHISVHHSNSSAENQDNDDENVKRNYRRRVQAVVDSLNQPSPTKKPELVKRAYNRKKVPESPSLASPETQVSASLLTCPACQEAFGSLDSRNEHVSQEHPAMLDLICQLCGLVFTTHSNYVRHQEHAHHTASATKITGKGGAETATYSCQACPLVFTNLADLSHHASLSHPEEALETALEMPLIEETPLETAAPLEVSLETALETVDGEIDMLAKADPKESASVCPQCEFAAHNRFELAVHSLTHSGSGNYGNGVLPASCPSCSRLFFGAGGRASLKEHYSVEHLRKAASAPSGEPLDREERFAFACSQCGAVFAGEGARARLAVHADTCTFELMDEDEFLDS